LQQVSCYEPGCYEEGFPLGECVRLSTTLHATPDRHFPSRWNSVADILPKTAVLDMLATVVAAYVLYGKLRTAQDLLHTSEEILTVGRLSLLGLGKMLGFMLFLFGGKKSQDFLFFHHPPWEMKTRAASLGCNAPTKKCTSLGLDLGRD